MAEIDPTVTPIAVADVSGGRTAVRVRQVVRDKAGNLIAEDEVEHSYIFENGLIRRMDIEPIA